MKTLPLIISLSLVALALSGCTAAPGTSTTDAGGIVIRPVTSVSEQSEGITRTRTSLGITGSITDTLLLDEMEADGAAQLHSISPALYKDTDILAAFFTYYAGGGYQIAVRQLPSGVIAVEKRSISEGSGDEPGGCGPWERLKEYPTTPSTTITWQNTGTPTDDVVIECDGW